MVHIKQIYVNLGVWNCLINFYNVFYYDYALLLVMQTFFVVFICVFSIFISANF